MVKSKILVNEIIKRFRENLNSFMNLENIAIMNCNDKLVEILKESITEIFEKYKND